jgi:hypothetical protein
MYTDSTRPSSTPRILAEYGVFLTGEEYSQIKSVTIEVLLNSAFWRAAGVNEAQLQKHSCDGSEGIEFWHKVKSIELV